MYRWNRQKTAWDLLDGAVQDIGSIERWATLRNSDATYLITSAASEHSCAYRGGNVWRFDPSIKLRVSIPSFLELGQCELFMKTILNVFQNVKNVDPWHDAAVDSEAGLLHLLGRSGIHTYSLEDRDVKLVNNKTLPQSGTCRNYCVW